MKSINTNNLICKISIDNKFQIKAAKMSLMSNIVTLMEFSIKIRLAKLNKITPIFRTNGREKNLTKNQVISSFLSLCILIQSYLFDFWEFS